LDFDERSWSKFAIRVAAVHLLVITVSPDAIHICVIWRKNFVLTITVFFGWGFQCCQRSLVERFAAIKLSFTIYTLTCPFGLTQYVPTDSCLDPVSVTPILSAHCLLPLVLSNPIVAIAY
jgi:hypothetical protein